MLLLAAVPQRLGPDAVHTGLRLADFDQTSDAVWVQVLNRATGTRQQLVASVLISADGLHSTTRARLHPKHTTLRWSGIIMWRGVTKTRPFLSGRSLVIANDERGVRFLAYPICRRAADRDRALINWVGLVPVAEPQPIDAQVDWNRASRVEDVLAYYATWRWDWLDVPALIAGSTQILQYPMVDRDPLPSWGSGRVSLLGDAAHLMYPIGANGASQPIIDARVLAYELATAYDPVAGLARYEQARRPVTTATVLANREMDRVERTAATRPRRDVATSARSPQSPAPTNTRPAAT